MKYYTTANFCVNLLNAITSFMLENDVKVFPLRWLAYEHYVNGSSKIARQFVENGHWEYFYIKNGKLFLHGCYNWGGTNRPWDDEVVAGRAVTYDERNKRSIMTSDLVNLIQVCYDTIGNVNFPHDNLICFSEDDIDESDYDARRNEVA